MYLHKTICRDNESLDIEITSEMECNLTHSKEKMELEQTKDNLKWAREVHFKYFPLQKMAHTKATVQKKGNDGGLRPCPNATNQEWVGRM